MTFQHFPKSKSASAGIKFDPSKQAKKAFHNAKQRCENQNCPDYPNYGGAGIKLVFASAQELINDIGLPKSPGLSLDRINPNGHYEPGNVRWASKAAQANNKKKSVGGAVPSIAQQIHQAQTIAAQPATRLEIAQAWAMTVRIINQGYLSASQVAWLSEHDVVAGLLNWSFDLSDHPDWNDGPGVFRLPSLTAPKKAISIAGGPVPHLGAIAPDDMTELQRWQVKTFENGGLINMLGRTPSIAKAQMIDNVPASVRAWMKPDLNDPDHFGAFWLGTPPVQAERLGWIEAMMMSLACYLGLKQTTMIKPLALILDALRDTASQYEMEEYPHLFQTVELLFIPDFQVDYAEGWSPSYEQWKWLKVLLEYRIKTKRRTFLGIQDPNKVPTWLRNLIFVKMNARHMPSHVQPYPMPTSLPRPALPGHHLAKDEWDLTRMREEKLAPIAFADV